MADRDQSLTVAVTGPTGEIGKPFIAALERAPEVERVIGMARRPFDLGAQGWEKVEYRRGDILDREAVEAWSREPTSSSTWPSSSSPAAGESREINLERLAQRLRGRCRRRREAARLHVLGRRLRVPPRHARAADRGPAGPRHRPPSLLGPQGRGRGGAGRGARGLGHGGLRLPPLHRRRPRRDPAARPDPPARARPEDSRARCAGRWARCRSCGPSCPTRACRSSSSTTTTSPRRSAPP